MLCHNTECEQRAYTVDDSLIYTDAFYFLQMIHYYKKKYINMREIIVVSMMMGKIGIKLTHLPKLLYACLTEANLGGFVPSPMSLLFLLRP